MNLKKNQSGVAALAIVLIVTVILAVGGAVYFITSSKDAEESSTSSQSSTSESSDSASEDTTASTGDYTIENTGELSPVCENQSFASGLSKTPGEKATAVLIQDKDGDYEFDSIGLSGDYRSDFSTTKVDRLACAERTEEVAFEESCTVSGTSFTLRGYKFNVTVYDLHTQEVIGESTTTHSKECPSFAAITDGVAEASNLDEASLVAYLEAL